jgi:hypothetical protein
MNQNRPNYQNSIRWNQPYGGWRKRQIIQQTLDDLHTQQMDMIDAAVDASDLRDAKELIEYIRNKGI